MNIVDDKHVHVGQIYWFKFEAKSTWRYFIKHNLYRKFRFHLKTLALHYQICPTCLLIGPTMHKSMICTSKFVVYMLILEGGMEKGGGGGGGWKFIDQMVSVMSFKFNSNVVFGAFVRVQIPLQSIELFEIKVMSHMPCTYQFLKL